MNKSFRFSPDSTENGFDFDYHRIFVFGNLNSIEIKRNICFNDRFKNDKNKIERNEENGKDGARISGGKMQAVRIICVDKP